MFEKYTERSRKVLNLARVEAQRLNSEFIGTEHILLGIIHEGGGVAYKVLKNFNVDPSRLRQEIEKLVTPSSGPTVTLGGQLPFSPRAKRVFELSEEAACRLGHDAIGTEHLLLGLLKENEGIAAQVLTNLGLKLDEVRDMVLEVLGVDAEFSSTVYRLELDSSLTRKQIREVVSAIQLIKGVASIGEARGVRDQVFHAIIESLKNAIGVVERLRDKAVDLGEESKKEEDIPPMSPS